VSRSSAHIGVGEVHAQKNAMALATGMDVEETYGTDQLCSGIKASIEGAVHTMWELLRKRLEQVATSLWWMPRIHITQSTGKLHCGMRGYYGQGALDSCLTPIGGILP